MTGWMKVREAARYSGVSIRTFRSWLKMGLRHSRLPTGTVLISFQAIDEFLSGYEVQENEASKITEKICKEMGL